MFLNVFGMFACFIILIILGCFAAPGMQNGGFIDCKHGPYVKQVVLLTSQPLSSFVTVGRVVENVS